MGIHAGVIYTEHERVDMYTRGIDASQQGFKDDLNQWCHVTGVELGILPWLLIALWGDSGPYSKRDSIYCACVS